MNYSIEKNLSKIIIFTFIIIMSSMIFAISYFYVTNTYDNFEVEMDKFVKEFHQEKKKTLKKEVHTVIDILNYNIAKSNLEDEELKTDAIKLLNNINFEENKSNYFFAYDVINMQGGDDFAVLVVNPNRPDLVGRLISTNYKDTDGKKFREDFMKDIRQKGESYTLYAYKKPNSDKSQYKLSYFKYYERFNWIIAVGIYTDDMENEIQLKREDLKQRIKKQIVQNVVLFLMFLSIAILISIVISQKIDDILKNYEEKVRKNANELESLNQSLEEKVKIEIEKNREKEQLLIQKSKLIALGEMISNIAHQWRQPLSELSSILMFIKFKFDLNALDSQTMDKKSKEATQVLEYMSHTIDDFRNFFMPKKDKEEFYLNKVINSIMTIVSSGLQNNNINVEINIDDNITLKTYLNEYQQVILNILKNAKDILIEKNIKNPLIKMEAKIDETHIILTIEDNGGGVFVEPLNKIFEPYFTTKSKSDGTGIGLYMSKIIVEKNMQGILKVKNTNLGAKFYICIPKIN
ncbi:cache domain-containing protein [Arcobacter aquimarinus]|uniref:histidine kinase n=1 Tax=Arcobacter aquimarinus TaxID=1315211 RepID=A0AAE7B368_9BACT|nr:cache domain-containing protein [Arcobacter aquimarinus]QKE25185.1 Cache sensor-containing two-component system histidine kinase [Arcobacter aquimarinus]RXI36367.1 ATP-binding protein [Arcobacter aquimarinus]